MAVMIAAVILSDCEAVVDLSLPVMQLFDECHDDGWSPGVPH